MCEILSWRLKSWPLPLTPYKYLYLWSDYRTREKGLMKADIYIYIYI